MSEGKGDALPQLWCLCLKPAGHNRSMIECDQCSFWYHYSCVGLSKKKAAVLETWSCSTCLRLEVTIKNPLKSVLGEISEKIIQDLELKMSSGFEALEKKIETLQVLSKTLNAEVEVVKEPNFPNFDAQEKMKQDLELKLSIGFKALEKKIQTLQDLNQTLSAEVEVVKEPNFDAQKMKQDLELKLSIGFEALEKKIQTLQDLSKKTFNAEVEVVKELVLQQKKAMEELQHMLLKSVKDSSKKLFEEIKDVTKLLVDTEKAAKEKKITKKLRDSTSGTSASLPVKAPTVQMKKKVYIDDSDDEPVCDSQSVKDNVDKRTQQGCVSSQSAKKRKSLSLPSSQASWK